MATLMQKDVLLEGVFQALGYAHGANADEATTAGIEAKTIQLQAGRSGFSGNNILYQGKY